ncbi:MAG: hypothetical protein ACPW60_13910 [Methylohalobius sp. ZOD2]|nr:hypothetical protein [Methylothermaceae bacterium]
MTLTGVFTLPAWGLLALMAATRFHHFGDFQTLPDASLAVFFLSGLLIADRRLFPVLLAAAGLIDYLAVAHAGVSDWCVTPAYLFLIPTYTALWLGGRWSRRFALDEAAGLARTLVALLASTLVAFLISNTSFYALSGYFNGTDFESYSVRMIPYLTPYVAAPLAYAALILAGRWGWRQLASGLPQEHPKS